MSILRWKQKLLADGGVARGGSGGGGGGPTYSTTQTSNIPEYARPYVETMLGTAQQQMYNYGPEGNVSGFKPYVPYGATVDAAGNITNTAQEQAAAAALAEKGKAAIEGYKQLTPASDAETLSVLDTKLSICDPGIASVFFTSNEFLISLQILEILAVSPK